VCSSIYSGSGWFGSSIPNERQYALLHQCRLDLTLESCRLKLMTVIYVHFYEWIYLVISACPRNFSSNLIFPVAQHANAPTVEYTRKGDSSLDMDERINPSRPQLWKSFLNL
jgi:hypothetical protein